MTWNTRRKYEEVSGGKKFWEYNVFKEDYRLGSQPVIRSKDLLKWIIEESWGSRKQKQWQTQQGQTS